MDVHHWTFDVFFGNAHHRSVGDVFTGDAIGFAEGSGTITHLGVRCLEIALDKGKQISVPYSRLSSRSLVKPSLARRIKSEI